ncbi:MAG: potassium-transporting ATPase subunit KdpC [Anaerolineae bacterium]|nr:potassium-transporting ATPase subunit KdpC [Anaerolineae bacterium]
MAAMLKQALRMLIMLTVLTGVIYPLMLTGIAQIVFPAQAHGSLIVKDGRPVGSWLIGQPFADPGYFWGRPSATSPFPYNASASSGSNLGPTSAALWEIIRQRVAALRAADPDNTALIPVDLVTASASGLDPHISVAAARYQAPRIARVRGIPETMLLELIEQHTEGRALAFLGEPRVNVLALNVALDEVDVE